MTFRLQTFGQPALFGTTSSAADSEKLLGPGKPLALLAFCCSVRDREHSRDYLATLLWSDSDATRGRQNLRQTMWRLRSVIGDALLATEDAVTGISNAVIADRDEFIAAVHRNDSAAALAIYHGAFLLGLSVPGGDEFEDWAANERRHLEDSLIRVVAAHAKGLVEHGRVASARDMIEQLLKRMPDNFDAHHIALELMLQMSDAGSALILADSLERIARAQERSTPAIETLISRARKRVQESVRETETLSLDLVGREEVFSAVMDSWARARSGTTTAVSLTGAPGIGKTRLLTALTQRCRSKGAIAVFVKANQGERDVTLAFAAAIARALATRPGAAGISMASARELVALDPALGSHFAAAPFGVEPSDNIRTKALAILDLLGAICEHQPLALMLDDLHWADAATRQVISLVIARAADFPLMIVVAFRGHAQPVSRDSVVNFPLLPLRDDEIVDAIRSTGKWPEHADANAFVNALANVCQGVPFAIVERLGLVSDQGLIVYSEGSWNAHDWLNAAALVSVAAPVDQRIESCTALERRVLLAIAVAGLPQTEAHLRRVLQGGFATQVAKIRDLVQPDVSTALAALEVRGLVVRINELWVPVHDVIAERLLELSTIAERSKVHLELAHIAAAGELRMAAVALRHYIAADHDEYASREFRRVVRYQRSIGDSRSARDILQQLGVDRISDERRRKLLSGVSLISRQGNIRARWVVAPLLVACTILAAIITTMLRQPQLIVSQAPMTTFPASVFSARTLRTMPSVAISVASELAAVAGGVVHVRAVDSETRIVAGDSARIHDGVALFNTLRFESTKPVVRLQFAADGYAATTLTVTNPITSDFRGLDESARLRLVGGTLNGTNLSAGASQIRVRAAAPINGFVQAEYSTHWPTATVWLSMTPTWGQPKLVGADITPIMTPVRREVADVPVRLQAPTVPGHYWIIFVIDAEDSGGYALSRTNWTVGHPIWTAGNEIARLSDAAIRRANEDGFVNTQVTYLRDWDVRSTRCEPLNVERELPLKLCARSTGLFGVEIIVE